MCFSTTASFSAGIVLAAIGIASIKKVQNPKHYAFASIPLIFSIQQFTEGVVWLSLSNTAYAAYLPAATCGFLLFAHIVWPVWAPFSFLLLEKDAKAKTRLYLFLGTGIVISVYFLYCLVFFKVSANIVEHHIFYGLDYPPSLTLLASGLYFIVTVIPSFFSKIKQMNWFGFAVAMSYVISILFFEQFVISVWCFFAAIISVLVYFIMNEVQTSSGKLLSQAI